jgi:hypothetical protein
MARQGQPLITLAKVPEIKPLEPATILFTGSRSVRFQQAKRAAQVAVIPGVLRQTHVGVVNILVGPLALAIDAKSGDRRRDS